MRTLQILTTEPVGKQNRIIMKKAASVKVMPAVVREQENCPTVVQSYGEDGIVNITDKESAEEPSKNTKQMEGKRDSSSLKIRTLRYLDAYGQKSNKTQEQPTNSYNFMKVYNSQKEMLAELPRTTKTNSRSLL
jgi:hypothetical protein